jgi:hypothetical protein
VLTGLSNGAAPGGDAPVLANSAPKPPPPLPDREVRAGRLVLSEEGGARGGVRCPLPLEVIVVGATAPGGVSAANGASPLLLSSTVLVSVPVCVCIVVVWKVLQYVQQRSVCVHGSLRLGGAVFAMVNAHALAWCTCARNYSRNIALHITSSTSQYLQMYEHEGC